MSIDRVWRMNGMGVRRARSEMVAETRAKLIEAGRRAFGSAGFAEASMDDFTAEAGLTRGALYHHFGGKEGLFAAVVAEIDRELTRRMEAASATAAGPFEGLVAESVAYLEAAQEPEIQRIVFRDGPAVLGDPANWPNAQGCLAATKASVERVRAAGLLAEVDTEAVARLLNGATRDAAQWIAGSEAPDLVAARAVAALRALLRGLLGPEGDAALTRAAGR